jgi:hypothetical protein
MECKDVLHYITAVFKDSAIKGETAKTTITAPLSMRNSESKEDESGNPQTTLTIEPRSLQHPPIAVEA